MDFFANQSELLKKHNARLISFFKNLPWLAWKPVALNCQIIAISFITISQFKANKSLFNNKKITCHMEGEGRVRKVPKKCDVFFKWPLITSIGENHINRPQVVGAKL